MPTQPPTLSGMENEHRPKCGDALRLVSKGRHGSFHTNTHTHTHTQPFYGSMDFVPDNRGEPVPEETFTHSHLSWSSIIPYLLHPSNMIYGILIPFLNKCVVGTGIMPLNPVNPN